MGAKYFQESGPNLLTCPQLQGAWVVNIFQNLASASGYMGAQYFQEFGQKYMPALCQEYMLFFCLPLSIQPRLNTQQQGRAPPVWPHGESEIGRRNYFDQETPILGDTCSRLV